MTRRVDPSAVVEAVRDILSNRIRTDLPFADLVLDARPIEETTSSRMKLLRLWETRACPSPSTVTSESVAPESVAEIVTTEHGPLVFEPLQFGPEGNPLWLFTFPDGFTMAVFVSPERVGTSDRQVLPITRISDERTVSPADRRRGLVVAAETLRVSALNAELWLEGFRFAFGPCRYSNDPVMLLVEGACYGFRSYEGLHRFSRTIGKDNLGAVLQFADVGFDVNDEEHHRWFATCTNYGYDRFLTRALARARPWHHTRTMYEAGWSLEALDYLHWSVVDRTAGYHHTTAEAWAAVPGGADEWVQVTGSARLASLCIAGGISLADAAQLVTSDGGVTLETMAALLSPADTRSNDSTGLAIPLTDTTQPVRRPLG